MQFFKSLCRHPLFWVMVIALFFRGYVDPQGFLDSKRGGRPNAESPDVASYLERPNLAAIIFDGDVNTMRTPVYPLFIDWHRQLVGEERLLDWLVFSQRMISLLSVFFFYRIAEYFIRRKFWIVTAALAYVVAVSVLLFNNWILTESLSVSGIVIWFYLLVDYVRKNAWYKAVLIAVVMFLLIMLRPAFLGLIVLLFVFWFLRFLFQREHLRNDLIGLVSLCAMVGFILAYSHLIFLKSGIFNLTVLGASNQYICSIQAGLFQDDDSPESRCMQKALAEYLDMFPKKAGDPLLLARSRTWTYPEDPINYITETLKKEEYLPTIKDRADYAKTLIGENKAKYAKFVFGKFLGLKKFYLVYALILLEAILIFQRWRRNGSLPILHCIFWLMITGLLFTAIAGAQDEYLRLSLPIFPFVILMPFQMLDAAMPFRKFSKNDPQKSESAVL